MQNLTFSISRFYISIIHFFNQIIVLLFQFYIFYFSILRYQIFNFIISVFAYFIARFQIFSYSLLITLLIFWYLNHSISLQFFDYSFRFLMVQSHSHDFLFWTHIFTFSLPSFNIFNFMVLFFWTISLFQSWTFTVLFSGFRIFNFITSLFRTRWFNFSNYFISLSFIFLVFVITPFYFILFPHFNISNH